MSCSEIPSFYTNFVTRECTACPSGCENCTHQGCQSCENTKTLNVLNNLCENSCPDGFYTNSSTRICQQCHLSCATCNGLTSKDCLTCSDTFVPNDLDNTCIKFCLEINHYFDSNLGECAPCDPSCLTCTSSTECTSCVRGKNLFEGECADTCPIGFWTDSLFNC